MGSSPSPWAADNRCRIKGIISFLMKELSGGKKFFYRQGR